jgi:phage tail protein X
MELVQPHSPLQEQALLQIMLAVVSAEGTRQMDPIERLSVEAIARHVLGFEPDLAACSLQIPEDLEISLPDPATRQWAVRMLMPLTLVQGRVEASAVKVVEKIATRLGAAEDDVALLNYPLRGHHRRFMWRITRNAVSDFWSKGGPTDFRGWFGAAEQSILAGVRTNARMAARYRDLKKLPASTLGSQLYQFYETNGWGMPGEKGAMPEHFVVHECTHILSGYGPTDHGEMLTAIFTAGAKKRHAMEWVLVSLLQWHHGAAVASISKKHAYSGLLQPEPFFNA